MKTNTGKGTNSGTGKAVSKSGVTTVKKAKDVVKSNFFNTRLNIPPLVIQLKKQICNFSFITGSREIVQKQKKSKVVQKPTKSDKPKGIRHTLNLLKCMPFPIVTCY